MYLYLVRHGQTLFNVKKYMQGWCDSPLTEKGIEQARQVKEKLKDVDFVYAYSSTSERAVDTLNLILQDRDIPKKALKGLKEFNFGRLEGEPEEYMKNTLKITHAEIYKYGGETIEQVVSRIKNQLLEIANIHAEGNVLCVSHGGVMINLLKDIAPDYIEYRIQNKLPIVDNCDVLILESDGTSLQLIQK